jgi:phosphoribosylformylglycinamidine cyclo-ligase
MNRKPKTIDYRKSGVNVDRADALVDWIKQQTDSKKLSSQKKIQTYKKMQVAGVGGFASISRLNFPSIKNLCIVTSTDGVGTKVKIAAHFEKFDSVGQDLVAMCVNDVITTGADPFLFLDYYAVDKLNLKSAKSFISGVKRACEKANCLLVGGETAEMPGVYQPNEFDCAGFSVGVVDQDQIWSSRNVKLGDRVIGISSSGFHSNGYSLLRQVFKSDLDKHRNLLLKPTEIYVKLVQLIRQKKIVVHSAAHITGGGVENLVRSFKENQVLKLRNWNWPKPFKVVQKRTGLSNCEMLRTLNCGVGFVFFVPEKSVSQILKLSRALNYKSYDLGLIEAKGRPNQQLLYEGRWA